MSSPQVPPWLQEKLMKLQQLQQNLQVIIAQKQQLETDNSEAESALDHLSKISENESVYKQIGSILIKSTKQDLIKDIKEKQELAKTRITVLTKQEERLKESLKDQETKLNQIIQSHTSSSAPPSQVNKR